MQEWSSEPVRTFGAMLHEPYLESVGTAIMPPAEVEATTRWGGHDCTRTVHQQKGNDESSPKPRTGTSRKRRGVSVRGQGEIVTERALVVEELIAKRSERSESVGSTSTLPGSREADREATRHRHASPHTRAPQGCEGETPKRWRSILQMSQSLQQQAGKSPAKDTATERRVKLGPIG